MYLSPIINIKLQVFVRESKLALNSFLYSAKMNMNLKTHAIYNEMTHDSILLTVVAVADALRLVWMLVRFKPRPYKVNRGCDRRPT